MWFARVPTEANIADYPSRLCPHPLLEPKDEVTSSAEVELASILKHVADVVAGRYTIGGGHIDGPM